MSGWLILLILGLSCPNRTRHVQPRLRPPRSRHRTLTATRDEWPLRVRDGTLGPC